jgi:hypothetical protein
MNRSAEGSIAIGLYPANKKIVGFPGSTRTPGSFGIYDNGYWQMERVSHDIAWPAGASESAKYCQ